MSQPISQAANSCQDLQFQKWFRNDTHTCKGPILSRLLVVLLSLGLWGVLRPSKYLQ